MFNFARRFRRRRDRGEELGRGLGVTGTLRAASGRAWRQMRRAMGRGVHRLTGVRRRVSDLLLGIPALVALFGVVGATAMGHVRQVAGGPRYWSAGERRLADGDHETAQLYLQRAMASESVNRHDVQYSLARAYSAGGQNDRADALIRQLAPADQIGYPPAHRMIALGSANQLAVTRQLPDVEAWHWHLTHADQSNTPAMQKAWGMYHLATRDVAAAITAFQNAAVEDPALWIQVAELQARMNDMDAVRRTLAKARHELESQFQRAPERAENRLLYATTLFYMGELPDVERLLKEGLQQEEDPAMRRLLAAVFVRMFDAEKDGPRGLEGSFQFLLTALHHDPGSQQVLMRLVQASQGSAENRAKSAEVMRRMIAAGDATPIAHFVLGSLEWMAGRNELAKLNFQQAMALDDQMPVVANNLAYLLALEKEADLDRALHLADQAVEADPGNASFLDTRALIHFKREEFAAAAVDYQRALPNASDPAKVRRQLAVIYDRLGDPETAEEFRRAAEEG